MMILNGDFTGASETLDLYSFNFNTHSDILTLLWRLNEIFERVGFRSQRVDVLHETHNLLEAEIAAAKRSFTLGVEGVSARMRAWLHKSLETDALVAVLNRLLAQRVREIKLFYIITGHEEESDIAEFRAFVRRLKQMRRQAGGGDRGRKGRGVDVHRVAVAEVVDDPGPAGDDFSDETGFSA